MKIAHRMLISFGSILFLLFVVAIVLVYSLLAIQKQRSLVEFVYEKMDCIRELENNLTNQSKEVADVILMEDEDEKLEEFEELEEFTENIDIYLEKWKKLVDKKIDFVEEEYGAIEKIEELYRTIIIGTKERLVNGDKEELIELAEDIEDYYEAKIFPLIKDVIEDEKKEIESVKINAQKAHAHILILDFTIICFGAVLVIILTLKVSKSIVKPLKILTGAIEEIRKGNFDIELKDTYEGEIEELKAAFIKMARDLKSSTVTIGRLKEEIDRNKKLEKSLKESNKELAQFAYVASHDLREPLRKIRSFGELLELSLEDKLDEDEKENLEYMISGAKKMDKMVKGLLAFSRSENRKTELANVDLNIIIKEIKDTHLSVLFEETKAQIEIQETLPVVYGDPVLLTQLFQNLISNAAKYHLEDINPYIRITAKEINENMVRIEVQDNGIGIKPEYHQEVFKMFRRVHTTNKYEGIGIGLALCKKIIQKHGGEIGVSSEEGQGSTFWLTLQLSPQQANELAAV